MMRGRCSLELDPLDVVVGTGPNSPPLASSLFALLLPASLELWECLAMSGEDWCGMCGDVPRKGPVESVGDNWSSTFRCEVDALFFFRNKFGWLEDLDGARDDGRDCCRNDCAEAAAARLEVERPACSACLSSLAST